VQVFSEGRNIALGCKARQSSTSNGGEAGRAVDGNTNGAYGSGTETHTQENDANPWWEVDLGGERPVEAVVVWNRSEGGGVYVHRLDNFTVSVLDSRRGEIFKKAGIPAPPESVKIAVGGGDPVGSLRSAAIRAAVSMQKEQPATFAALVRLIEKGDQVAIAARGMRALPRAAWDKAQAANAATALVAWAKRIPAGERTSQDYVETVQFAGDLAGFLPPEKATDLRKELKELRVSVFVVNTVREQMRYDTARLVVEAGKPFEIILAQAQRPQAGRRVRLLLHLPRPLGTHVGPADRDEGRRHVSPGPPGCRPGRAGRGPGSRAPSLGVMVWVEKVSVRK
jgi:hypothetical protein